MKKVILLSSALFFLSITIVNAQGYELLQDLPGIRDVPDLPGLIEGLINIVIAIGVLLAVIMLAFGGLQYMMTDVVTTKESAKKSMGQAIFGLLLILGSYLILFLINPAIVQNGTNFLSGVKAPANIPSEDRIPQKTYELTTKTITNNTKGSGELWKSANCNPDKTREAERSGEKTGVVETTTKENEKDCKYLTVPDSFRKPDNRKGTYTCSFTVTCVKKDGK